MRIAILAAALVFSSCRDGRDAEPVPPQNPATSGAVSPAGDKHPGEIVHDDKVDGRVWARRAAEVPVGIAWVELDGKWTPVVRIEITGSRERRTMTAYGIGGLVLQRTVQAPSPAPR